MPRARSRRSSSVFWISASICVSISAASAGSRGVRSRASRVFTDSATSCCCAPSWMLRSSRRRSWSCAVTSRRCEARSSSTRRTLRRTRPACDARSRTRRSFDGFIGSLGASRPRGRRGARPGPEPRRRSRPRSSGGPRPSRGRPPRARRRSATRPPVAAPRPGGATPWPSRPRWPGPRICAMRPRTSSVAYDSPTRSENSVSTSYGVARPAVDDPVGDPAREPRHRAGTRDRAAARRRTPSRSSRCRR